MKIPPINLYSIQTTIAMALWIALGQLQKTERK